MNYYISDLHIHHKNVIRFDNRPFADTDLMNAVLVNNWNERVTEDDHVYVLGDAFWKNEEESLKILKELKGHLHLVRGNHDAVKGRLRFQWESIEDYMEVNDNGRFVILSHYPIPFYRNQHYGAVMLYGHVHNTREWELVEKWQKEVWNVGIPSRLINAGCMMPYMKYTPRTLDEILEANPAPEFERVDEEAESKNEEGGGLVKKADMKWFVFVESVNRKEIYEMNVFDHGGFTADLEKFLKKRPTREELSEELRHITMYYFWSKCEWEVLLTSWVHGGRDDAPERKIDVYDQLKMNWDHFVDYVWQFAPKKRPRTKEGVVDEL